MRLGDLIWAAGLGAIALFLYFPTTRGLFVETTKAYPYVMGFCKVSVLATMGELLTVRITGGRWAMPLGLPLRSAVWGMFGLAFVLMFEVFSSGVASALDKGLLSGGFVDTASFVRAFWISAVMNLTFAPTFMAVHRITDTYIDLAGGRLTGLAGMELRRVMAAIDWPGFVSFVVLRSLPLFWIPAHTITFLLPPEYRIMMAALLSIALGAILAFAKRKPVLRRIK